MYAAEPAGFEAFWTDFINYVYPATQIIYWLVMIAVAVYVAMLFKRWVDFKTGAIEKKATGDKVNDVLTEDEDSEDKISIEEFVE